MLRILAVDQTHGCGYEVEVAGSESAGRACRPARQSMQHLPPPGNAYGYTERLVCDVVFREQPHVCRASARSNLRQH